MQTRLNFRALCRALPVALALLASPCAQAGGEISPNFRGEDDMHVSFADTGLLAFRAGPGVFNDLPPNWSAPSGSFVAPRYSPSFVPFDRSGDVANSERFAMTPIADGVVNAPDATTATIEWANVGATFSSGGNWLGGVAPANSTVTDIGSFSSAGGSAVNPNLTANRSINGIRFIGGAFAYTFGSTTGSILLIGTGGIVNSSANPETFGSTFTIATSATESWTSNLGATLVFNGVVDINNNAGTARILTLNGAGDFTFNSTSIIQNSNAGSTGSLTFIGSGTLTLSGANTYTGLTTVSSGTVNAINNSALGSSTDSTAGLLMNPGSGSATINFTSATPAIASLASSGAGTSSVVLGNTTTPAATTLTVGGNNASTIFAGVISDLSGTNAAATGTLTKIGTGTLTLSGANTYTGSTSVTGGTLLVINTTGSGTGTSSVVVTNAGTTLSGGTTSGTGGISGSVAINPSATLSPGTSGNGAGTTAILNTGALTLVSGANFSLDLNGTTAGSGYDQLISSGPIVLSGSNILVTASNSLSLTDTFFVLLNSGATTNTGLFAQGATVTADNGYVFAINYLDTGDGTPGNDISLTLTAVPEPSTWIGGALALAAIGFTQRRKLRCLLVRCA